MTGNAYSSMRPFISGRGAQLVLAGALLAGLMTVVAMAGSWQGGARTRATLSPEDIARQFCLPVPPEARASPADVPDHEAVMVAPDAPPASISTSSSLSVRTGDIVKLTTKSSVAGAVGVHGLSEIKVVQSGGSVDIKFRAIYSGRFPLHFHGIDGSHFELMVINVTSH